ncbi:hypothetical protein GCM10020295_48850 [Streptomyces cinereospinus]
MITQNESEPTSSDALTTGYSYGFLLGAGLYLLALLTALLTAPKSAPQPQQGGAQAPVSL